ncbi:MAG: hypothetical protein ACRD2N_01770 [Vicinamibacterales bacterium]
MSKAPKTSGNTIKISPLHTALDKTVDRLKKKKKSRKRDQLIALIKGLRKKTFCIPQIMIIDLGK